MIMQLPNCGKWCAPFFIQELSSNDRWSYKLYSRTGNEIINNSLCQIWSV